MPVRAEGAVHSLDQLALSALHPSLGALEAAPATDEGAPAHLLHVGRLLLLALLLLALVRVERVRESRKGARVFGRRWKRTLLEGQRVLVSRRSERRPGGKPRACGSPSLLGELVRVAGVRETGKCPWCGRERAWPHLPLHWPERRSSRAPRRAQWSSSGGGRRPRAGRRGERERWSELRHSSIISWTALVCLRIPPVMQPCIQQTACLRACMHIPTSRPDTRVIWHRRSQATPGPDTHATPVLRALANKTRVRPGAACA